MSHERQRLNPEPILVCAAIWYDNGKKYVHQPKNIATGLVIAGLRHHNCIATLAILDDQFKQGCSRSIQGFLTSDNRFLTRDEAKEFLTVCGYDTTGIQSELTSEDLY